MTIDRATTPIGSVFHLLEKQGETPTSELAIIWFKMSTVQLHVAVSVWLRSNNSLISVVIMAGNEECRAFVIEMSFKNE